MKFIDQLADGMKDAAKQIRESKFVAGFKEAYNGFLKEEGMESLLDRPKGSQKVNDFVLYGTAIAAAVVFSTFSLGTAVLGLIVTAPLAVLTRNAFVNSANHAMSVTDDFGQFLKKTLTTPFKCFYKATVGGLKAEGYLSGKDSSAMPPADAGQQSSVFTNDGKTNSFNSAADPAGNDNKTVATQTRDNTLKNNMN